jgi:hypothetical protein
MAEERAQRRLAAILASDIVGYSRLIGLDEEGTLAALKEHRRELIDPKVEQHHGRIVKTTGDGALIEFASVVDAVRCALDVQRGTAERNVGVRPDRRIEFRIGINVGDIVIDGIRTKAPGKPLTYSPVPLSWTTTTRKPMASARSALHGARCRVGRIERRPLRKSLKRPIARSRAIPRNPGLILRMALSLWRSCVMPTQSVRSARPSTRVPTLHMRMGCLGAPIPRADGQSKPLSASIVAYD